MNIQETHTQFQNVSQDKTPKTVVDWQNKAYQEFQNKGLPKKGSKLWRYTNIEPFLSEGKLETGLEVTGSPEISEEIKQMIQGRSQRLVFVNGIVRMDLSKTKQEGLQVTPILDYFNQKDAPSLPDFFRPRSKESSMAELDLLNQAFLNQGAVIGFTGEATEPLHLFFVTTTKSPLISHPRIYVEVKEGAQGALEEVFICEGNGQYVNNVITQINIAPAGKLTHVKIQDESEKALHFSQTDVTLEKNSSYNGLCQYQGAALSRNDISVDLRGVGADAQLNGLYTLKNQQQSDHYTQIIHSERETTSQQLYKGILDDKSVGVFHGQVFVEQDAQLISSGQLNKNLLLSQGAQVHTIPQLEIDADDVKCSHGATIGQISEEELFYLQSRGIKKERARSLLVQGFGDDVIGKVERPDFIKDCHEHLTSYFSAKD